jgi:hypothetical protein
VRIFLIFVISSQRFDSGSWEYDYCEIITQGPVMNGIYNLCKGYVQVFIADRLEELQHAANNKCIKLLVLNDFDIRNSGVFIAIPAPKERNILALDNALGNKHTPDQTFKKKLQERK